MTEILSFDPDACRAMWRAYGKKGSFDAFRIRASLTLAFWSLYDQGHPVGGALFESDGRLDAPVMHIATEATGKAAFATRRIVGWALEKWGRIYAPVSETNSAVCRLAEGLGFELVSAKNGARLYRRQR